MDGRARYRNYLDEFVFNCQWLRQTMWAGQGAPPRLYDRVRAVERAGPGLPGFIYEGNLLDPYFTRMPMVSFRNFPQGSLKERTIIFYNNGILLLLLLLLVLLTFFLEENCTQG